MHKALEIKRKFSLWVNDNFKHFEDGTDFTRVRTSTLVNNGAMRELQDYAVTLDMAKELCMMSKTSKGREVRKYFIQVEKGLELSRQDYGACFANCSRQSSKAGNAK